MFKSFRTFELGSRDGNQAAKIPKPGGFDEKNGFGKEERGGP